MRRQRGRRSSRGKLRRFKSGGKASKVNIVGGQRF